MMSEPRDCNKCDRKMDKDELFYHSRDDEDLDLCTTCFDKKVNKRKISPDDFQLMVYCLPPGIQLKLYIYKRTNILTRVLSVK